MSDLIYTKATVDTLLTSANSYTDTQISAAGIGAASPGQVAVSTFAGATADAKLTAALSAVAADTHKREILLDQYDVTYTLTGRPTFSGMKLCGLNVGWQNVELSSGALVWPFTVNVGSGTSSWFVGGAQTYDISFRKLALKSSNGVSQMYHHPTSAGTSYGLSMDTLDLYGWKHILGSPTAPFSSTLLTWKGEWTVNGVFDTQFTLNLSDSLGMNPTCMNIGAGSTAGAGKFLIIANYVGKSTMSGIYATCNNGWAGLKVLGDTTGAVGFTVRDCVFEGRNKDDASDGALIRVEGGRVFINDTNVNYGLANTAANGRSEQGLIQVAGGQCIANNITIDKATGVTEANCIAMYVSSGYGKITNVFTGAKAGAWTGLPRVHGVTTKDETTTSV